jgi:hypothetical protein
MRALPRFALPALLIAIVTATIAIAMAACSSTSSTGLATNDISADLYVSISDNDPNMLKGVSDAGAPDAPDTGHTSDNFISATLYKDGNLLDAVNLGDGDNLFVTTNLAAMAPMPRGLPGFYEPADMDLQHVTFAEFILQRKSGAAAPSSKVTVPPAMMLTSPKQDDMLSASSGKITFAWATPNAGSKIFAYAHPCDSFSASGTNKDNSKDDTGSYDLAFSDIPGGVPTQPTCYLARVIRRNIGTVDPAWHGGSTCFADREVWVSFTVMP